MANQGNRLPTRHDRNASAVHEQIDFIWESRGCPELPLVAMAATHAKQVCVGYGAMEDQNFLTFTDAIDAAVRDFRRSHNFKLPRTTRSEDALGMRTRGWILVRDIAPDREVHVEVAVREHPRQMTTVGGIGYRDRELETIAYCERDVESKEALNDLPFFLALPAFPAETVQQTTISDGQSGQHILKIVKRLHESLSFLEDTVRDLHGPSARLSNKAVACRFGLSGLDLRRRLVALVFRP